MNHAGIRERLSAYLERDLVGAERLDVEAHLSRCEECATELAELRETVLLLRGLPKLEAPSYLATRVMARIADGEGEPRGLSHFLASRWASALAAPLAAAIAALAVVSLAPSAGTPVVVVKETGAALPRPLLDQATLTGPTLLADHRPLPPRVVPVALTVSPAAVQALLRGAGHPHSNALAEHFQRPHEAVFVSWAGGSH